MASATCENSDCDRTEWELQKAPGEYSDGVRCPSCGTSNTDVTFNDPADGGATQPREETAPATRQEPAQAPAPEGQPGGGAAELFAAVDDDVDPARRAQAAGSVASRLSNLASQFFQYQEAKQQAAKERAENANLEQTDYPRCDGELPSGEECTYQFGPDDIGVGNSTVRCPECQTVYQIDG